MPEAITFEVLFKFFDSLGIGTNDRFTIIGACGVGAVDVYSNRTNRRIRFRFIDGRLEIFDPSDLSLEERNTLVVHLLQTGNFSQSEVAGLIGLTQALVSKIWQHRKKIGKYHAT